MPNSVSTGFGPAIKTATCHNDLNNAQQPIYVLQVGFPFLHPGFTKPTVKGAGPEVSFLHPGCGVLLELS